jgi:hypothetical protein
MILKWNLRKITYDGVGRIRLDQVQWWTLLNTITNLRVPQKGGEFRDQLNDNQFLKDVSVPYSVEIKKKELVSSCREDNALKT